jgi:hypothetical protein
MKSVCGKSRIPGDVYEWSNGQRVPEVVEPAKCPALPTCGKRVIKQRAGGAISMLYKVCFFFLSPLSPFRKRSGGGIGRHARLRGVCRKVWGFESPPEHHSSLAFARRSRDSDGAASSGSRREASRTQNPWRQRINLPVQSGAPNAPGWPAPPPGRNRTCFASDGGKCIPQVVPVCQRVRSSRRP